MSIPHILHFGLFRGYEPNALEKRCMEGWAKILPGWEIRFWCDENGPTHSRFFRDALKGRVANASSYTRLWVLAEHGGVFVDTDVEILQPFETGHSCFLGLQREDLLAECANSAVLGSVPGHPFIADCLTRLDRMGAAASEVECGPNLVTAELRKRGLREAKEQMVGDIRLFAKEVFYPFRWDQTPERKYITPRTVAIHWWNGSWATRHPAARDNFVDP